MKYTAVLIGCLLLHVGSASAVESFPQAAGPGVASCGKYIETSKDPEGERLFTSWALGYLSGAQLAFRQQYLTLPDSDAVKVYMHNYCQANPLEDYGTGAVKLVSDLISKQFSTAPSKGH